MFISEAFPNPSHPIPSCVMFNSKRRERFEEEASARAAREAESEARKALWRAEEAQVRRLADGVGSLGVKR